MSWLRLDDDFAQNPKIFALNDREFRRWIRLLCWCAKFNTSGAVSKGALRELGIPKRMAGTFVTLGLLEDSSGDLVVHDWKEYNPKDPTGAVRQARFRNAHSNGESNGPSRAQARAGVPVPQVPTEPKGSSGTRKDELWDALVAELGEPATSSERGRRNKALKELREIAATPDDIRLRAASYRRQWPGVTLTATALAANWSLCNGASGELSPEEKRARRMEQVNRSMAERGLQ